MPAISRVRRGIFGLRGRSTPPFSPPRSLRLRQFRDLRRLQSSILAFPQSAQASWPFLLDAYRAAKPMYNNFVRAHDGGYAKNKRRARRIDSGRELLAEQFWLCRGNRTRRARIARRPPRHADHSKNLHLLESGARDKQAQAISVEIGGRQLHASVEQIEQVVRDDTLHHVIIAESQPHPEAVQFRPAEKHLPLRREWLQEFPDEVNGLHVGQRRGLMLALWGQKVDRLGPS